MDRINQIRGEVGDSRDLTLDTSSLPSEAFMSANESSSKYYSLSEVDSTFSISPSKDTTALTVDSESTITPDTDIISTISPIPKTDADNFKIGERIEAANILSGGVNIFDDNDNSYDGDELVIDDDATLDEEKIKENEAASPEKIEEGLSMDEMEAIQSKDTEVVLQIDGKNVDAINIGNQLYLYRKAGKEELAAVQIIDDDKQQPTFKFLKVRDECNYRENTEGNLEVYEEIEVEIPKDVATKYGSSTDKTAHVPNKGINKVINETFCNKAIDKVKIKPNIGSNTNCALSCADPSIDAQLICKSEVNLNKKMMKFKESRKSSLIGTYTPMTYHSTPNKEGVPLTKTMVDQQLHPSRHSDNIKKTIEVHTDSCKPKFVDSCTKIKDLNKTPKMGELETFITDTLESHNELTIVEHSQKEVDTGNKVTIEEVISVSCNAQNEETNKNCMKTQIVKYAPTDNGNEQKVECMEVTMGHTKHLIKKTKNTTAENTITSINLIGTSALKESTQYKNKHEEKIGDLILNENIDDKNNSSVKNSDNMTRTEKQENDDLNINKSTGNLLSLEDSLKADVGGEEVALTTELVCDDELSEDLKSLMKDNGIQVIDPIINVQETTNNDLFSSNDEKSLINKKTFETITNTLTDKESRSDNICGSGKDTFNQDLIFKINKDIIKQSDNSESNLNNEEKHISKSDISQVLNKINKSSEEVGLEKQNDNEDMSANIQGILNIREDTKDSKVSSLERKSALSLVSLQKNVLESQNTCESSDTVTNSNNCIEEVPFGQWTDVNRQAFVSHIKVEPKVPSNNSNTNQIKQTNDLNRRDVLKKFDSLRQSTVTKPVNSSNFGSVPKFCRTNTTAFANKSTVMQQSNPPKTVSPSLNTQTESLTLKSTVTKEESLNTQMLEQLRFINGQDIIDKTIDGIISRAIKIKTIPEHMKEQRTIHTVENPKDAMPLPGSLDDIELKMEELHGISFNEQPAQEHSQLYDSKMSFKSENLNVNKGSKIPNLLPFKAKNQQKTLKQTRDDTSDEEIIEHEPITGDIEISNQNLISLLSSKEKPLMETKKDSIITEKDFDKFARRNSMTYENCLTVNFNNKEKHSVVQTVIEKKPPVKKLTRNELLLAESKAKSINKQIAAARHINQTSKIPTLKSVNEEIKNYQNKLQIAYQSALTAKRNQDYPITIIEDKPVKVVYMDTAEYTPTQLNVQGQDLSPSKNQNSDSDVFVHSASESLDSDILDSNHDNKSQDEIKCKSKHQRKQVFTPVQEEPEIQLIEPSDLGITVSPTKKRRTEEKAIKNAKNLGPKKAHSLGEYTSKPEQPKNIFKETGNRNEPFMGHTNTITAIDNLVKAAELIETQSENNSTNALTSNEVNEIPLNSPVKRGRGRPRKYPLPEPGSDINKSLSPHKKPRLIDAKVTRSFTDSDESSDGEIVKENWTMGKINENIVCPICNKLFRSENVVFKHVKHCTGPSPNRSDSDQRSPRRLRHSRESDRKLSDSGLDDTDSDEEEKVKSLRSHHDVSKLVNDDDVILTKDTSFKENPTDEKINYRETKKVLRKSKLHHVTNNLMCEVCGKTFRQLSYLVNHKLQHKNEVTRKGNESEHVNHKSVFSCEVCKKEFRKLHHLVQHRSIHDPSTVASRSQRKTSSEQHENKNSKNSKNDEACAGFRCEPCDKSFRKLFHLVEHRETHDGINKKGNTNTSQVLTESKSLLAHHCDICKKVFKKLQDLLEHKELHIDSCSEKSDDKSVKSSLSTKDIIHECSLCYMVFPNEHSLNKHTVICLRKKKQSAAKQAAKQAEGDKTIEADNLISDENLLQAIEINKEDCVDDSEITEIAQETSENNQQLDQVNINKEMEIEDLNKELQEKQQEIEIKTIPEVISKKRHSIIAQKIKNTEEIETPAKIKKIDNKEHNTNKDTPTQKNKIINKDKTSPTTKRHRSLNIIVEPKPSLECSDDEEIRYMLNPNFKEDETPERKFMKIRALKRNSLQIERRDPKDLAKRRISLQHPPKMPRLKAKPVETKPVTATLVAKKLKTITEKTISTDSDDSDVKYSFPEKAHLNTSSKKVEKKVKRQSLAAKRKSLTGIAKRKSLGKSTMAINKPKRRTTEPEHRCDCGELFSSAALLSRHTSHAHTPPRIRKRRSPPPEVPPHTSTQAITKPPTTKHPITKPPITKPPVSKIPIIKPPNTKFTKPNIEPKKTKSNVTISNKANVGVSTRKSSVSNTETKTADAGKSVKSESNFKSLRSANKSSVPDKNRKVADKSKK